MGFRFRRSIQICKGLRLNLSKGGISASLGIKGKTLNIGRFGIQETLSLPGSGISYKTPRRTIGLSRRPQSTRSAPHRGWFSVLFGD